MNQKNYKAFKISFLQKCNYFWTSKYTFFEICRINEFFMLFTISRLKLKKLKRCLLISAILPKTKRKYYDTGKGNLDQPDWKSVIWETAWNILGEIYFKPFTWPLTFSVRKKYPENIFPVRGRYKTFSAQKRNEINADFF